MPNLDDIIRQLGQLETEQPNPRTAHIDQLGAGDIVRLINAEDQTVPLTVASALPAIATAAERFAATIRRGGRVFYVGAGTSGRLGVLDAAECPPTFGTNPSQIVGVIAGGDEALQLSREGVEDNTEAAVADLKRHGLAAKDMVIGIAASRRTPYTLAALQYARELGCATVYIICNVPDAGTTPADLIISLPVGPEVITGSTRMKSGTAQKLTLNLISTTAMVLLGKTYGNLMVDLQARSEKLAARSRRILMELLQIDLPAAEKLLSEANGSVKTALVMHRLGCDAAEAGRRIAEAGGLLWKLLGPPQSG